MKRRSAREIRHHRLNLEIPFYRFSITEVTKSDQHELLLELENENEFVFYVAPRFHTLKQINAAWNDNEVAARSVFVKPSMIGALDGNVHHVSFDHVDAFLCSEPKAIEIITSNDLQKALSRKLDTKDRPLRDEIQDVVFSLKRSIEITSARSKISTEDIYGTPVSELEDTQPISIPGKKAPQIEPIAVREPKPISNEKEALRNIADISAKEFTAQFIVVQHKT